MKRLATTTHKHVSIHEKECNLCNRKGTKRCKADGECECRKKYHGNFCTKCKDPYSYVAMDGTCTPCPCPAEMSTGTCLFQAHMNRVVCEECKVPYGGFDCTLCGFGYKDAPNKNGTCVPNTGIEEPANSPPILVTAVSVSIVLSLVVGLAVFGLVQYCRAKKYRKKRRCLVGEERVLLMETPFDTPNGVSHRSVRSRSFGGAKDGDNHGGLGREDEWMTPNQAVAFSSEFRDNDSVDSVDFDAVNPLYDHYRRQDFDQVLYKNWKKQDPKSSGKSDHKRTKGNTEMGEDCEKEPLKRDTSSFYRISGDDEDDAQDVDHS